MSSNLAPPSQNTAAIEIAPDSPGVSIDLNGHPPRLQLARRASDRGAELWRRDLGRKPILHQRPHRWSNGEEGIIGPDGFVTVDGCVTNANGVDGIFVRQRSLVRGSMTPTNGDAGIAAFTNLQILESGANGNVDRGITAPGQQTGVGLNAANGNGGLNLSGGVIVACNVIGGFLVCP